MLKARVIKGEMQLMKNTILKTDRENVKDYMLVFGTILLLSDIFLIKVDMNEDERIAITRRKFHIEKKMILSVGRGRFYCS